MKSLFKISSAVVLFTAMLSRLGYKKSNNPMVTTAFEVSLKVDQNLSQRLADTDDRSPYIFSNSPSHYEE